MMLAQITNGVSGGSLPDPHSPAAIGWVCIIGLTLIMGLRQVMGFVREMKQGDGPQKRDVTISTGTVSAGELKEHVAWDQSEHDKIFAKVGGVERGAGKALTEQIDALRKERSDDAKVLAQRLSDIDKGLGGLNKATDLQNTTLAQITNKLTDIALSK